MITSWQGLDDLGARFDELLQAAGLKERGLDLVRGRGGVVGRRRQVVVMAVDDVYDRHGPRGKAAPQLDLQAAMGFGRDADHQGIAQPPEPQRQAEGGPVAQAPPQMVAAAKRSAAARSWQFCNSAARTSAGGKFFSGSSTLPSTASRSPHGPPRRFLPGGQRGARVHGPGEAKPLARRQHPFQRRQRGIAELAAVGVGHGGAIVVSPPRPQFAGRPQQEQARRAAAGLLDRFAHRPDIVGRESAGCRRRALSDDRHS